MDRQTRKLNKIRKEFKAMQLLNDELKVGNRYSQAIRQRLLQVKQMMAEVNDILYINPDFISREFYKELEQEKRMLISMTIQYGWPKTYLKKLFEKQKQERIQNQQNHV
jgi:hypothetical protein